jgi:hypothetical protein
MRVNLPIVAILDIYVPIRGVYARRARILGTPPPIKHTVNPTNCLAAAPRSHRSPLQAFYQLLVSETPYTPFRIRAQQSNRYLQAYYEYNPHRETHLRQLLYHFDE